jgi:hypothetical protein
MKAVFSSKRAFYGIHPGAYRYAPQGHRYSAPHSTQIHCVVHGGMVGSTHQHLKGSITLVQLG